MALRIACPSCNAINTIEDDKRGRRVPCRKCTEPIRVPARNKKPDEEDGLPVKKMKKQPAQKGFPVVLAALGGVALLLVVLLGLAGASAFFMLRSQPAGVDQQELQAKGDVKKPNEKDEEKTPRIDPAGSKKENPDVDPNKNKSPDPKNPDPNPSDVNQPDLNKNPKPKKDPNPPVDANVGKPLPEQMTPEMVDQVKQATVYLRVTLPGGQVAEGSGFFAAEPGIIITNAHVLGMLQSSSRPPKQVEVVLNSGEPAESKITGQVLGVDRESDLAVVRVPASKPLPTPLTLEKTQRPFETQKVYIFGFPYGERLGKDITISPSAITSLRKSPAGVLKEIQINGGMHPGNSGGPVVNSLGNLVGVSVAVITGTQINFAIPANQVRMIMEGRLSATQWGEAYAQAGQPHLPVQYQCLDPLRRISALRVETWTGQPGPARASALEPPTPRPGDSPRQSHGIPYQDGAGSLDVPLPSLKPGEVYWLQPVITTPQGDQWGPAQATATTMALVEHVPANLTVSFTTQKERTSKMTSTFTSTLSSGKKKLVMTERTHAELLEVVHPEDSNGQQVAKIKTSFGMLGISIDKDGRKIIIPNQMQALAAVRNMPPVFVIDQRNATASYIKVSLNAKNPLRELVEEINGMIHNPYEAATVQMPNKTVQPLETFPAKSTILFRTENKAIIVDLIMTCTYEGKRQREGRDEAVLTVVGQLRGRKEMIGRIEGNITGKVGFDIAGGYLSLVQLKIIADNEEQIPGLGSIQRIMQHEIEVNRSAGNPKNLQLAQEKSPGPGPNPGPVPTGKVLLMINGILSPTDPPDPTPVLSQKNARMKVHGLPMEMDRTYVISLNSTAFDSYLRLENPQGQQVAEDDDGGGSLNARIVYRATQSGIHRIIATSFDGKTGPYQLIVQEASKENPGANPKKEDVAKENPKKDPPKDLPQAGDAPPPGWMEATPKNKFYLVWMPTNGKPIESEDSIVNPSYGQVRIFRIVCERDDGSLWISSSINLPPQLVKSPPKVRQDFFRDLFLQEFKGKLVQEKRIMQDTLSGMEYLIKTPKGMGRFRLLGTGVLIYRLIVVGSEEQMASKDVDTFFNSFKRPKRIDPVLEKEPIAKENQDPVPAGGIGNPAPNPFFSGDVQLRHLTFSYPKGGKILGDLVWARDGKSFYMLYENGMLQRISLATGHTEQFTEIGSPCGNLAMSSAGLLVSVLGRAEVWVIPPDNLGDVKTKIAVAGLKRVTSGVSSSVAFAGHADRSGWGDLHAIDLKEGKVQKTHAKMPTALFTASPDGKYLFTVGKIEQLLRYRVEGVDLTEEDASYRISTNGSAICISPDSKYVGLAAGGGNGSGHPNHPALGNYSTFIYPINDLKRPAASFVAGAYPRAVGIDPKSGCILAQNMQKPLIIFTFTSTNKLSEYDCPPISRGTVLEFSVSPLGSEAILRTEKSLIHIKIQRGAQPPTGLLEPGPRQRWPVEGMLPASHASYRDHGS